MDREGQLEASSSGSVLEMLGVSQTSVLPRGTEVPKIKYPGQVCKTSSGSGLLSSCPSLLSNLSPAPSNLGGAESATLTPEFPATLRGLSLFLWTCSLVNSTDDDG